MKLAEKRLVHKLINKFQSSSNDQMVDYTYKNHPYFSIYSEWDMSFEQEELVRQEQRRIKDQDTQILFTIGYEGKSIDAYLNELVKNNISLLCDVRRNPLSMKYGFSKNQLNKYCSNESHRKTTSARCSLRRPQD